MCGSLLRSWHRFFFLALTLFGLSLLGISIYVFADVKSTFGILLLTISGLTLVTGVLSFISINNKSTTLVRISSLLFLAVIAVQSAITIGYLFFPDKFTEFLLKFDNKTGSKINDYLSNNTNKQAIRFTTLPVLIIELITWLTMVICKNQVIGYQALDADDDAVINLSPDRNAPLLSSASGSYLGSSSRTPITDRKRDELNEKYGGVFAKRGTADNYL